MRSHEAWCCLSAAQPAFMAARSCQAAADQPSICSLCGRRQEAAHQLADLLVTASGSRGSNQTTAGAYHGRSEGSERTRCTTGSGDHQQEPSGSEQQQQAATKLQGEPQQASDRWRACGTCCNQQQRQIDEEHVAHAAIRGSDRLRLHAACRSYTLIAHLGYIPPAAAAS